MSRGVYGVFVVLIGLFVISSIYQVARRVFGDPADGSGGTLIEGPCAQAIEDEMRAIEAARLAASTEKTGDAAKDRYLAERRISGERSADRDALCRDAPQRIEALAALARLDRASEAHAVRESSELSPVRLAAQSFIRGPR